MHTPKPTIGEARLRIDDEVSGAAD
jgi:hypothetical protein